MKKIVLSGYYGFGNTGDEAILYAITEGLKDLPNEVDLVVLSHMPAMTSQAYGVKSQSRWPLARVKRSLKGCSLFISGGGSLLQDRTSSRSILYYLGLVNMARYMGAKTALFACGMGPIKRRWLRTVTRWSLARMDYLSVRDEESIAFLKELGFKKEVGLVPDPVFNLVPPARETTEEILAREGISYKRPLLLMAPRAKPNEEGDWRQWVDIGGRLQRFGFQVLLWPLFPQEDMDLCQAVAWRLGAGILEASYSTPRLLDLLRGVDVVLGVRYHALLMAAVAGSLPVGVSYDPKVTSLLKMFDLPCELSLDALFGNQVLQCVMATWDDRHTTLERIHDKVGRWAHIVQQGFTEIKNLL